MRKHFTSVNSTNVWTKQNLTELLKFDSHSNFIALVTADSQTEGIGRHARKWISPPGNLYATFCLKIVQPSPNWAQILSLSAIQTLLKFGVKAQLKWPNDILLNDKKLGGVLCEIVSHEDRLVLIAGIGLNINMTQEWIDQIQTQATSLQIENKKNYDVNAILEDLSGVFFDNAKRYIEMGFTFFLPYYRQVLVHHEGDKIKIKSANRIIEGTFVKILDNGTMQIRQDNGSVIDIASGEC